LRQKQQSIPADRTGALNFAGLVDAIRSVHEQLSRHALKAVNVGLTVRNWLIGFYIREYEQHGSDRAKYGEQLLQRLSERLPPDDAFSYCSLKLYRQFYDSYPNIGQTASAQSPKTNRKSPSSESALSVSRRPGEVVPAAVGMLPERLVGSLSFSHFAELMKTGDPLKRTFY